jgi:hypothetical protein
VPYAAVISPAADRQRAEAANDQSIISRPSTSSTLNNLPLRRDGITIGGSKVLMTVTFTVYVQTQKVG